MKKGITVLSIAIGHFVFRDRKMIADLGLKMRSQCHRDRDLNFGDFLPFDWQIMKKSYLRNNSKSNKLLDIYSCA